MNQKLDPRALGPEEKEMREALQEKVFGQDRVIEAVSSAFGFYNSPLRNPDKPIGVFILAGPPGVGKMKITQALAEHLFRDPMGFCYVNCDKPVPLEQRSLDKAHQQMLEALHKEDVDKLYDRGGELMEEREQIDKDEATINKAELRKRKILYNKKYAKLGKDLEEAAIKGWCYEENNPPQNLLSIVFFDHVAEAD